MSERDLSVRRVLSLAFPALIVLAAEPLYLLVDTAVVGHLGGTQLAALAIGATVMAQVAGQFNFLAYGTTARAARQHGAGSHAGAVREGANATVLALIIGGLAILVVQLWAWPIARFIGGSQSPALDGAVAWLRIAILGAPGLLLALAGNGWMRGIQRTREPTVYVTLGFGLCVVLLPVMVYGLGWGLIGSAIANVVAQTITGGLFVLALVREQAPWRVDPQIMRGQLRTGRDLLLRTLALLGSFLAAAAFASRMGADVLGAHQIGLQLFMFCALVLDSIAIAAQSLVGAALGREDAGQARRTASLVARVGSVCGLIAAAILLAGTTLIPRIFTSDADVLAQAAIMWPWLAGMQLAAGLLFALDGVMMGANDVAVLRTITIFAHAGVYLPIAFLALHLGWGIGGIWLGLTSSIVIRLLLGMWRVRSGRWLHATVR